VHQNSPHLNGQYAAFGRVTAGMDIVDRICEDTPVVEKQRHRARAKSTRYHAVRIMKCEERGDSQ
jgi:peptidyl-prolyl cis-trans isomerase B (cyclophilin B)